MSEIEIIATRVQTLEQQMAALLSVTGSQPRKKDWRRTVGMFADDPGFDDVIRLGREWRAEANRDVPDVRP